MNPSDNKVKPLATIGSRLASIDSRVQAFDSRVDVALREMVSSAIVGTAMVRLAVRAMTFRKPTVTFRLPDSRKQPCSEHLAQVASTFTTNGFHFYYGEDIRFSMEPRAFVTTEAKIPCNYVWFTTRGPYDSLKSFSGNTTKTSNWSDYMLLDMDESDLKKIVLSEWEGIAGGYYMTTPLYHQAKVPYLTERATACLVGTAMKGRNWYILSGTERNLLLRAFFELVQSGDIPVEEALRNPGFPVDKALDVLSAPVTLVDQVTLEKL